MLVHMQVRCAPWLMRSGKGVDGLMSLAAAGLLSGAALPLSNCCTLAACDRLEGTVIELPRLVKLAAGLPACCSCCCCCGEGLVDGLGVADGLSTGGAGLDGREGLLEGEAGILAGGAGLLAGVARPLSAGTG